MTPLQFKVLRAIETRRDLFVSVEMLTKELHVSRSAIMQSINSLEQNGYRFDSLNCLEYRLEYSPDIIDSEYIHSLLNEDGLDVDVRTYLTIDSTNNEGKRLAHDLKRPLLLIAEEQTMGRGRQGHTFYSPPKTGLYMSVVVPSSLPLGIMALCTQLMAVAAYQAVIESGGPELTIKWVNDLYLGNKKTAGILTEAVTGLETLHAYAVICGIGLNLTTFQFPNEIINKAGSLGAINRNKLASRITARFLLFMNELPSTSGWLDIYRERSLVIGKSVSFVQNGQTYQGIGKEIDDQGRLIVRLVDGSEFTLSSGEVSIIPSFS